MKLCMIGTGYVGLVSGVCFSDIGNNVICVDRDSDKIKNLKKGNIPIYEPGLEELVLKNVKNNRLKFSTNLKESISKSDIVFICVGTPTKKNGSGADLSQVFNVAKEIRSSITKFKIIVTKSTVPVTTGDEIEKIILKKVSKKLFTVVSNPEFLREGEAIRDFTYPDRVVIGTNNKKSNIILKNLYTPLISKGAKYINCSRRAAELIKYASNAFLATKITFINELANLCEKLNIDIEDISIGMGLDKRIGSKFLHAGPGFGGSCFPKDVKALTKIAKENGYNAHLINAVEVVNDAQKLVIAQKIVKRFSENLKGHTFGIWGLAFKPGTDDMREAPSIYVIKELISRGAKIKVFDPKAVNEAKEYYLKGLEKVEYVGSKYDVLMGSDALVLLTEWKEFRIPNFEKIKSLLKNPIIFDGRNQYNAFNLEEMGIEYHQIGKQ